MIYRHTPQQVQDYYDTIGINQSAIKVLISEGIEAFLAKREELQTTNELYYEERTHFLVGSAVDAFFSYGQEVFDTLYAKSKMTRKPPDKPMSIIRMVFDKAVETNQVRPALASYSEDLYSAADVHQYYMNRRIPSEKLIKGKPDERTWQDDKRIEGMLADGICQVYWTELINSIGKQLLSDEESQIIDAVVMSLTTHPHTSAIFREGTEDDLDVIFQMPLYFDLMDTRCKGMLDILGINHDEKTILPLDIKTMGRYVTRFPQEFRFRRYDIQGAFYKKGISLCLNAISTLISKDVSGYEIVKFAFVAESTIKPGTPLIYQMSAEVEQEGTSGDSEGLLGYEQGLELLNEWDKVDFSITKKFEETEGVIVLNKDYYKTKI